MARCRLLIALMLLWAGLGPVWAQTIIISPSGGGTVSPADLAPGGSSDISATYATRAYADAIAQGLDVKLSVVVGSTANLTLSGEQTIDGVLTSASRILVKNQTTGSENGIYVTAAGAWALAPDADTSGEVTAGLFTFIEQGTTQANTGWALSTDNPITLGTTVLTFTQFSGAADVLAGTCLDKAGNTLSVEPGCLSATQMADLGITGAKLANLTIPGSKLQADAITGDKVASETLTHLDIAPANKDGAAATPSLRTLGTGATQATAGNDARLSDQRTPLDNSVTAAKIVNGTITEAKLAFDPATQAELDAVTAASGAVGLDLGNNGSSEAANITKITTAGDTNAIFSETVDNQLHINAALDWPKADLADGLVTASLTESMISGGLLNPAAGSYGLRTLGGGAGEAAAGNDGRFPTLDQRAALVGTDGTPDATNPFVTTSDARVPPVNNSAVIDPPEGVLCENVDIDGVIYRLNSLWRNVGATPSRMWECAPEGWSRLMSANEGGPVASLEQARAGSRTFTGAVSEATAVQWAPSGFLGLSCSMWTDPAGEFNVKCTPSPDKIFRLQSGTRFAIENDETGAEIAACDVTGCTGFEGSGSGNTLTDQQAFDAGNGRIGPLTAIKPRVFFGETEEYQWFEQGGNFFERIIDRVSGLDIPRHVNVLPGLTKIFQGDGVDIFTLDADTATLTFHSAPLLDDGLKLTLNPNATNAGLNVGSQAGDPSSLANGDIWYNSSTGKFRCRENGATANCIGAGGGSSIIFDIGDDAGNDSTALGEIATSGDTTAIFSEPSADKLLVDLTKRWPANPVAPILSSSAIPVTSGMVYGCPIDGDMMMCVTTATLLTSDAIWRLNFEMPPTLASGCTYKLQLDGKANATSGVLRINPKWNTWAPGVTRTSLTLNAESVTPDSVTGAAGSGDTVTWGAGDGLQLLRVKWTLNASTVTAAQRIAMDLTFEDASTTLAVESGWMASIICE